MILLTVNGNRSVADVLGYTVCEISLHLSRLEIAVFAYCILIVDAVQYQRILYIAEKFF